MGIEDKKYFADDRWSLRQIMAYRRVGEAGGSRLSAYTAAMLVGVSKNSAHHIEVEYDNGSLLPWKIRVVSCRGDS